MQIAEGIYRAFSEVASTYSKGLLEHLPQAALGLFIVIVGYFFAWIAGLFVKKVLYHLNLDQKLRKADLDDSFGKISLAKLFGTLTKWSIFFVFFAKGISFMDIGVIKIFSSEVAKWTLLITVIVIVIVIGFVFIDFVLYKVWEIRTKYDSAIQVSSRILLVLTVVLTILEQEGIDLSFLKTVFLLIFSAVLLSASMAVGIGLGVGISRNVAVMNWFKKRKI